MKKVKRRDGCYVRIRNVGSCLSNPARGWRPLKEMESDYEPVIVPARPDTMQDHETRRLTPCTKVLDAGFLPWLACVPEAVGLRWGDIRDGVIHVLRRWSAGELGRTENRTLQSPSCMHSSYFACSFIQGEWRRISPQASDGDWISLRSRCRENPNVGWHLRYGLSSSCRA